VVDPVRTFRLSDDFIARLDAWALTQADAPTRSEAIRCLVAIGLAESRLRARIERVLDAAAPMSAG
jgi:hypothetical protein